MLVRIFNKSVFGIPDPGIPSDWLILTVFVKIERLRSQREMRYGGDDKLYVPSRRIRTRNKHSAERLFHAVHSISVW